jgi:hypothetical protein
MLIQITRFFRIFVVVFAVVYFAVALYMRHSETVSAKALMAAAPALQTGNAPASGKLRELWWKTMRGLDYKKGTVSDELKSYDGTRLRIPGFMVPLEDDAEKVSEFLLVPYVGACIHTPPPPPNQIVHVKMAKGRSIPMYWYDPVWIEGDFKIENVKSMYGNVSFTMVGHSQEMYKEDQK